MSDDALVIARWCWPKSTWTWDVDTGLAFSKYHSQGWPGGLDAAEDAERALIERGHAEAYGRALNQALFGDAWGEQELWNGEQWAKLATAPLNVRVRAMAAVIRSLEP